MFLQKAKIVFLFFNFCGFFLSCNNKRKQAEELLHKINNAHSSIESVGSFVPKSTEEKLIDLTDLEAAKNIKEEEKDLAKKAITLLAQQTGVTLTFKEAREILKKFSNVASTFGEGKREFFEVFENQIDQAVEVVFKEKKETTYSVDDLIEMRSEVLNKAYNEVFRELDKNNNGIEVKELEVFLIAKSPLKISEDQAGFDGLMSQRALSIMIELSSDGKTLTLKEFLSLSSLLQKLHDKIVIDLFSQD